MDMANCSLRWLGLTEIQAGEIQAGELNQREAMMTHGNSGVGRWALLALLALLLATPGHGELTANWRSSAEDAALAGAPDIVHGEWMAVRPGGSPVRLHRYRLAKEGGPKPKASLLYLPGTFMNGRVALAAEEHNLWVYLARRGVEVFTLDYRSSSLSRLPGADVDPQILEHWTLARYLEDVQHAAWQVRRLSGRQKLFVAGFSRGVTFAYGLALSEPDGVGGVVALDGYFKHHAPKNSDDFDTRRAALDAAGDWLLDVGGSRGWEARQALMRAAAADPRGPALGQDTGTVGEQLGEILFFAYGPGALANTRVGISRIEILATLMQAYDRYYPKIHSLEAEVLAAWADYPRSSLDDSLGEVELPVIFFGSSGMGSEFLLNGIHSAALLAGGKAEIHLLEGWGHLDILVANEAPEKVFKPLLTWLEGQIPQARRVGPRD